MTLENYRAPEWTCGYLAEATRKTFLFDAPWHYPWGNHKRVLAGQRTPVRVHLPHGTYYGGDSREFCRNVLALDPCAYCGEPVECIEHVDPVAKGGENDWTNFTASCRRCNQSKSASTLLQFLARRKPRPKAHRAQSGAPCISPSSLTTSSRSTRSTRTAG
jgi:HNH endonuclease